MHFQCLLNKSLHNPYIVSGISYQSYSIFSVLELWFLSERRYRFVELNASFRHLASCFSGDTWMFVISLPSSWPPNHQFHDACCTPNTYHLLNWVKTLILQKASSFHSSRVCKGSCRWCLNAPTSSFTFNDENAQSCGMHSCDPYWNLLWNLHIQAQAILL